MQKITPFLWFDSQAGAAAKFYTSIFKKAKLLNIVRYSEAGAVASGKPPGSAMTVVFQLEGLKFVALNGGPQFKFSPAISFFVSCKTTAEINRLWRKLSAGGQVLMPLNEYPFSKKFGWLQDKFGLSWQLNLGAHPQKIRPFLLFVGQQHGRAGEAVKFYTSRFKKSRVINLEHHPAGSGEPAGTVKRASFSLFGQEFLAMDSTLAHKFAFPQAISFVVDCPTQRDVDYFWSKLSAGGIQGSCGWLKDKFDIWWQIVPPVLGELLGDADAAKVERVMQALLTMDKLNLAALKKARVQSTSGSPIQQPAQRPKTKRAVA